MPARAKKIVKKPKRIRPKFTLKGTKTASIPKEAVGKVEENRESEGDLGRVVEPPIDVSSSPATDVPPFPQTVQPPPNQFAPVSPPPSQFVVSSAPVDTVAPQNAAAPAASVSESTEKPIIETVPEKKKKSWVFPVVLLLIFLLGLGGGLFYFFSTNDGVKLSFMPSAATPTKTPSPKEVMTTEAPETTVDSAEYPVRILNGSGVAGEAGRAESLLQKEGFVVSDTGNAEKYDYEETVIQVRKGIKKAFIDKLIKVLEQSYVVASAPASLEGQEGDVVVIVGSKQVE